MKNPNISFLLSFFLLFVVSCSKTNDPAPVKSTEKQITSFKMTVNAQEIVGTITEADKKISLDLPYKSDVKALSPVVAISDKATISPASGVAQDFTNPIKFTVKAEDGSTAEYLVTATISLPTKCFPITNSYSQEGYSRQFTYHYNSNDKLTKFDVTSSNGFSGSGTYTLDPKGNVIKLEGSIFAPSNGYFSYTYNDKNQLIRGERFTATGSLDNKNEYGYNDFGQRISEDRFYTYFDGSLKKSSSKIFEYKTSATKDYFLEKAFDENGQLYSTKENEYDDKKIPFLNALSYEPLHNITKETKKDALGNVVYVKISTYEYNELGYPTKIVSNIDEYEKSNVTTMTYTYDCK